jgi:hypothetical protein
MKELPEDFVFWYKDQPILLSELIAWNPKIENMFFAEALGYISMFVGDTKEPQPINSSMWEFKMVKPPSEDDPEYIQWTRLKELEHQVIQLQKEFNEFDKGLSNKSTFEEKSKWSSLLYNLSLKKEYLAEANKNYSMISKLSGSDTK